MKSRIKIVPIIVFLLILTPFAFAEDIYKPYIHEPEIPDHPELNLHGNFQTALWPGAATYSYPINVPPGRNGLQPSLDISYNSHSNNGRPGIIGTAWTLTDNHIYRDTENTFSTSSDDTFHLSLNGNVYELVYVSNENRYHTKQESFLRIVKHTDAPNSKGFFWIVTTQDGTQYRFGYTPDSELVSNQHNYVTRWSLDQIQDTHDNKISYTYLEDPNAEDIGTVYPYKIEYNNEKSRVIEFILENRPDIWTVFEHGNKIKYTKRIKFIDVKTNDQLVNRYELTYINNEHSSRSYLSSLKIYGNDGTTSLPPITFEYEDSNYGWVEDTTWDIPTEARFGTTSDYGVRFVDLNNDGLTDLVKNDDGDRAAWINTGDGWEQNNNWNIPIRIVDRSNDDYGTRFIELNGDGYIDIVQADSPSTRRAWINTKRGWTSTNNWDLPSGAHPVDEDENEFDRGIRFTDLNGDKKTDILQSVGSTQRAWLNNGNGWSSSTSFRPPSDAEFISSITNPRDEGTRIMDINGDGLPDLVRAEFSERLVWLNTGNGWELDESRSFPHYVVWSREDQGIRVTDLNGDGLPDVLHGEGGTRKEAWINTGSTFRLDSDWENPELANFVTSNDGENNGVRIADVNGDGLPDLFNAASRTFRASYLNKNTKDFLLKKITNEFGGTIELDYTKSTDFDNSGEDDLSDLGFNMWLVQTESHDNGMSGPHALNYNIYYNYYNGLFDQEDEEFRGFSYVQELYPQEQLLHKYHQDDILKGKEFETVIWDLSYRPYQTTKYTWDSDTTNGYHKVFITEEINELYDGSYDTPKTTKIEYDYDNKGNIIEVYNHGDISNNNDQIIEKWTYVANSVKWIINTPKIYSKYHNQLNNKVEEIKYQYDDQSYGYGPTHGDLSREEFWNSDGENPFVSYEYDQYGNLIREINANANPTTYSYGAVETTSSFPDSITNALGHTTSFTYDLGTGNILSETDPNDIIISYIYDQFGRIIKEIQPYDSEQYPTKIYSYNLDGSAPESITVKEREQAGTTNTLDKTSFFDGFGNFIQQNNEGESGKVVSTNFFLDHNGRNIKVSNPKFIYNSISTNYVTPNENTPHSSFIYDPLSRVIEVKNPDNTIKTINFDHGEITTLDENDNQLKYITDAHGQIQQAIEYLNDNYYITNYDYDGSGNLRQITDPYRNIWTFDYNTLGQKTSERDPDRGVWSYYYDNNGNLVRTIDANNNDIEIRYDALDRITQKRGGGMSYSFRYDEDKLGIVSRISGLNYLAYLTFDDRDRKTEERVFIKGMGYTSRYQYDSLNRITSLRLPDGTTKEYLYNNQGLLNSISGIITDIDYNAINKPREITYANNLETDYFYNPRTLQLEQIQTGTLQDIEYNYDNAGNILSIRNNPLGEYEELTYDPLNRLTSARKTKNEEPFYDLQYSYNPLGSLNLLKVNDEKYPYYYGNFPAHSPVRLSLPSNVIPPTLVTPLGGENIEKGNNFEIVWEESETNGEDTTYSIEYSEDSGQTWHYLESGIQDVENYDWDTTNLEEGKSYKIRVKAVPVLPATTAMIALTASIDDNSMEDVSDANFNIVPTQDVIVHPQIDENHLKSSYYIGQRVGIQWREASFNGEKLPLKVEYTSNGGITWDLIADNRAGVASSWYTSDLEESDMYLIRLSATLPDNTVITDLSDNFITLTEPASTAFSVTNSNQEPLAYIDNSGNLFLKRAIKRIPWEPTPIYHFRLNNNGQDIFMIDDEGYVHIIGSRFENSEIITPIQSDTEFIVKNKEGEIIAKVAENGDLYLKGRIIASGIN